MGRMSQPTIYIEMGISLFLNGLFLVAYLAMDGWVIEAMPSTVSPAFFPTLTALFLFLCSVALTGISLRGVSRALTGKTLPAGEGGEEHPRILALIGYIVVMFLYLLGLHYVGFVVSTPLVMLAVALMLGIRRWLIGLVCYVAFALLLNSVSFHFMQIILPTGVLFE